MATNSMRLTKRRSRRCVKERTKPDESVPNGEAIVATLASSPSRSRLHDLDSGVLHPDIAIAIFAEVGVQPTPYPATVSTPLGGVSRTPRIWGLGNEPRGRG